jgi:hypothetical protein
MHQIKIALGFFSAPDEGVIAYCKHFDCKAIKVIREDSWFVSSDKMENFYLLGLNQTLTSGSSLSQTPAEKYLGIGKNKGNG